MVAEDHNMGATDDGIATGSSDALERLRAEFAASDVGPGERAESVQRADEQLDQVIEGFLSDPTFSFDEETVKGNLGEILLTLIQSRSAETNGKRLMEDLSRVFDADLSPGTVYPKLHQLEEDGLLERHELVQTKEYKIDKPDTARDRIAARMRQHLVLGLYYQRVLEDC